jgi:hypothetical protein
LAAGFFFAGDDGDDGDDGRAGAEAAGRLPSMRDGGWERVDDGDGMGRATGDG